MKRPYKQPLVLFVALAAVGLTAADGEGQRRRGGAGPASPMVERALRLGDEIGLSQDQRIELESLRLSILAERQTAAAQLMALRSEVQAGIREPEAMRQEMEALREAAETERDSRRDQVQEILTEEQRDQLQELGRRRGNRGRSFQGQGQRRGPWSGRGRARWNQGSM
ncbi:MAG: hypothetical protein HKN73_15570 [Gemmatimonadetes bacterium]|nr:hypothetical protein [Gemmatimonadota bacterium]